MLGFSPLASAPLGDDGAVSAGAAILASASTSAACDFNASVKRAVQGAAVSASALTATATANVLSSILASASTSAALATSSSSAYVFDASAATSAALATSASAVSFTAASASASLATSITASALATKSGRAYSALALTGRVRGNSAVNVSAIVTAHAAVIAFARYKWEDATRPVDVWTDAPAAGGDWAVKVKTDKNWSDAA